MRVFKISLLLATAVIFAAACDQSAVAINGPQNTDSVASNSQPQQSAPVDNATTAKELYAINCMICHKDSGKGGKITIQGRAINPADLASGHMKKHSDEKIFSHISDGDPDEGMPSFKDKLTDDEIKMIVTHIRSLQAQ